MSNTRISQWALFLTGQGVGHETHSNIDRLPYVLLIEGTNHECLGIVPYQEGTGVTEAPPLEENTVVKDQSDHMQFTDGSSNCEDRKQFTEYGMVNLDK